MSNFAVDMLGETIDGAGTGADESALLAASVLHNLEARWGSVGYYYPNNAQPGIRQTLVRFSTSETETEPDPSSFNTAFWRRVFSRSSGGGNANLAAVVQEVNADGDESTRTGFELYGLFRPTASSAGHHFLFGASADVGSAPPFTDPAQLANTAGLYYGVTDDSGSGGRPATPLTDVEVLSTNGGTALANRTRTPIAGGRNLGDWQEWAIAFDRAAASMTVRGYNLTDQAWITPEAGIVHATTIPAQTARLGMFLVQNVRGVATSNPATFEVAIIKIGRP